MTKKKYHIQKEKKKQDAGLTPLAERKVIKVKQNAGGYYEGMPGVHLDELGNRKFIDFIMTEDGYATCRVYAHPKLIKNAIEDACDTNTELKAIIQGAALDTVFKKKGFLNFIITRELRRRRKRAVKRLTKEKQKEEKLNADLETNTKGTT